MALEIEGSFNGANVETHKVAANGTTAVTVATKFSKVYGVFYSWAEAPDNATYRVYTFSISGGTVTFKCTNATTKDVFVLVLGHT